jgi:hypothetical protein
MRYGQSGPFYLRVTYYPYSAIRVRTSGPWCPPLTGQAASPTLTRRRPAPGRWPA